jgi:hypothetical protein
VANCVNSNAYGLNIREGGSMTDHIQTAEAYYQAMNDKNLDKVKSYLHPDAKLISPMAGEAQSDSMLDAISRFMTSLNSIKIRSKCESGNQVMLAVDVEFPPPIGQLRSAVLMTFQDNLIVSVELFHDTKPFAGFAVQQ